MVPPEALPVHNDNVWVYIVLGAMTMISTIVVGWFAYDGRRHAREANEAVNMRHLNGVNENGDPIHPRLYDAVLDTKRLSESTDMKVDMLAYRQERTEEKVKNVQAHMFVVSDHVTDLDRRLSSHVAWEEEQKYSNAEPTDPPEPNKEEGEPS